MLLCTGVRWQRRCFVGGCDVVQLVVPLTVAATSDQFRTREDWTAINLDTAKAMANRGGFNSVAERKSSTRTHAAETSQLYRMGTKEEKLKEAMYIRCPAALRSAGKGGGSSRSRWACSAAG